jgi:gamma-glutamyltranspeptidase/glutathione hydrolase
VPGLGFLLNNEMDDFAAKAGAANMFGLVQGEGNTIRPGKRPLSAMTPTIVLRDGKLFMTVGAPGGSRIITAVTQVFLNVADFGMNVQDAVDAPRFHHQWQPDILFLERGFSPDTIELLRQRGFHPTTVEPRAASDPPSTTSAERGRDVTVARVEAILIDKGWLQGGSDGRALGKAAGY